jgi:hypothetical protein
MNADSDTHSSKTEHRRSCSGIFVFIVFPSMLVLAICLWIFWPHHLHINQIPFDEEKWKAWSEKIEFDNDHNPLPTVRQMMIRDLIENILPGKSSEEIEAVLGRSPSHQDVFIYQNGEWNLIYLIGLYKRDFFDAHPELLIIVLSKDGIFKSWYIAGSKDWPRIVGEKAASSRYRERQDQ